MVTVRQGIAESVKALVVLALLFLSFGHKPIEPSYTNGAALGIYTLADGTVPIFCGQAGPAGDQGDHSPCHACRVGNVILPPAPCTVEPAFASADFVTYAPPVPRFFATASTIPLGARAPPAA